jgi:hypothetical protein
VAGESVSYPIDPEREQIFQFLAKYSPQAKVRIPVCIVVDAD